MPSFTGSGANQPVIECRQSSGPFSVLAAVPFTGTGVNNSILLGATSALSTFRIYNNFANAGSIHDAVNCVLASYDDATNWGQATTTPVTGLWMGLKVTDYNGTATGADTTFFSIGGQTKHAVPVNSGTIQGASSNYISVSAQVTVPANATIASGQQGIWLEYNWT